MKQSDLAMSLAIAIKNKGIKAIEKPKYREHVKKTIIIKWADSTNGNVFYIDELNRLMGEYPKSFNCDVFNPPMLGELEEYELTMEEYHKWKNDIIYNPQKEYQPPK